MDKINFQNKPNQTTPVNATNMNKLQDNVENEFNKIKNELEKLDPETPYTQATGTYTTAQWATGTNNCTWTAPRTGLYIIWARFDCENTRKAKVYKHLQLKGTATRISGDLLLYQEGGTSSSSSESTYQAIQIFESSKLVYAEQGQTVIPYIHCPEAGIVWDVKLTGLFLK